jgi:hypothetical protein
MEELPQKELKKKDKKKSKDDKEKEEKDDSGNEEKDDESEDGETGDDEVEEKPFIDRVQDLLDSLKYIKMPGPDDEKEEEERKKEKTKDSKRKKGKKAKPITYAIDPGLKAFQSILDLIKKKEGEQRENLEDCLKETFEEFYTDSREHLLKENMEFLTNGEDIEIVFGDSGAATLRISEMYRNLNKYNVELIDNVDASIYYIIQHVCPEEDFERVFAICQNFEPDSQGTGSNFLEFVGTIVGRVSDKLEGKDAGNMETEDGKIDKNAIGGVVQDLIGDDVIRGSMQNMIDTISKDSFDINSVFKGLFNMQKGSQSKRGEKDESDE